MSPKAVKKTEAEKAAEFAAIEAAAHIRAREISVEVFGGVPDFGTIHKVREACIYIDEDGELDEKEISNSIDGLKFAVAWLGDVNPGEGLTVDNALLAFKVLSNEPSIEEDVEEIKETMDQLVDILGEDDEDEDEDDE